MKALFCSIETKHRYRGDDGIIRYVHFHPTALDSGETVYSYCTAIAAEFVNGLLKRVPTVSSYPRDMCKEIFDPG